MADSILRDKAKVFAKTVVLLCRDMKANTMMVLKQSDNF